VVMLQKATIPTATADIANVMRLRMVVPRNLWSPRNTSLDSLAT
jgi:hypothetical protein